jgi:hypothetical protein
MGMNILLSVQFVLKTMAVDICKCGHSKEDHYTNLKLCKICHLKGCYSGTHKGCGHFRPDNLRYLEHLSLQKDVDRIISTPLMS